MNDRKKPDTVVIIPAFNEEESIGLVLDEIPQARVIQVIVVDNNSTDKTATIAQQHGALVVSEKKRGYGKACLTGVERALKLMPRYLVFLDGDYSDSPSELDLICTQLDNGHELVIGSRVLGQAAPGALLPQARFGNWLATTLLKILFPSFELRFSDLGPFRGIQTEAYQKLKMCDENFGWTIEMQTKAIIQQLKCCEVPVSYKKRIGQSKITGTFKGSFLAGIIILKTIFSLYFSSLKKDYKGQRNH